MYNSVEGNKPKGEGFGTYVTSVTILSTNFDLVICSPTRKKAKRGRGNRKDKLTLWGIFLKEK